MATIQKNDFVQVDYTGSFKEDGSVFDTTDESTAKKEQLFNPGMKFGSIVLWVGQGQLFSKIEDSLVGKDVGSEFSVELTPEESFGKKDAKLLKLVPMSVFKKQNINPQPGLQLNIDGGIGTIRTVSGGRVVVDFNHPFSGKDIIYKVTPKKIITDLKEKVESYVKMQLSIPDVEVAVNGKDVSITLGTQLPKEVHGIIEAKVKEIDSSISSVIVGSKDGKDDKKSVESKDSQK